MAFIKRCFSIAIAILVFILVSVAVYYLNPGFASSNLYMALATFIVGSFAIGIYIKQKQDNKRDAANLILSEIRAAERLIDRFKASGVSNNFVNQLLPNNHWSRHSYLFVNDLDSDEIEEINNFYNQCTVLDRAIDQINISYELRNKSQAIHQSISSVARDVVGLGLTNPEDIQREFTKRKNSFVTLMSNDDFTFRPDAPAQSIAQTLTNIRFITTSTAGKKLKEIAGVK